MERDGIFGGTPAEPTLAEKVASHLREHIRTNDLAPGDRVPSESETSAALGVSRNIVREAYRSLAAIGVIATANGKPPRVGALKDDALALVFDHAVTTRQATPEHILEVRRWLEVGTARQAARFRLRSDLDEMEAALRGMKEAIGDIDGYVRHDLRFHFAVARAGRNPVCEILITAVRKPMIETIRRGLAQRTASKWNQSYALHHAIFKAIEAMEPDEAGRQMERHFEDAQAAVRAFRPRQDTRHDRRVTPCI